LSPLARLISSNLSVENAARANSAYSSGRPLFLPFQSIRWALDVKLRSESLYAGAKGRGRNVRGDFKLNHKDWEPKRCVPPLDGLNLGVEQTDCKSSVRGERPVLERSRKTLLSDIWISNR